MDNSTLDEAMEDWRPVIGFEGCYEVSNLGRVKSLDRESTRSDGVRRMLKGKVLNPYCSTKNYPRVHLWSDSNNKWARVHNLVLEAFKGPRPKGMVACHNDGDSSNNTAANLRWDTYRSNNLDLVKHGTHWQSSKTHCKNNHEFTTENTYIRAEGGRKCKRCTLRSNKIRAAR